MPRLTFEVTIPPDPTRQRVAVAGTDHALGNWQPEHGLELLRCDDGRFRGACDLPHGIIEFKITRGSWDNEETWADGTPVLNYQHLVVHDFALSIEVESWKDCAPPPQETLYGQTLECELDATQLGHHRRAVVWLPPGYVRSADSRHPVLYLFDGQDSLAALGGVENETIAADDWVRRLSRRGLLPELILVAIFHREDFGQRDTELSPQCDGPKLADFVVNDLKPFIDYTLCRDRTLPAPEHTGVLGFGLGGALALWMATRHQGTIARFACISPAYEDLSADTPDDCELVRTLCAARSLKPGAAKIYLDHGTYGGDESTALYQEHITAALIAKKMTQPRDFTVNVAHGADHTLTAWRARLGGALTFLFGNTKPPAK